MAISHAFSNPIANATGTLTVWNGATTATVAATDIVRPQDWNSAHNQYLTLAGNTAGASTVSGTNIVFQGGSNMTLSANGSTVVFSAAGGGGGITRNYFNPQDAYVQVVGQQGNNVLHMQPAYFPDVTMDRVAFPVVFSNSTNSTGTVSLSMQIGVYTRNASTFSLLASTSVSQAITFSGTVGNSTFNGMRLLTAPWSTSFPEDQYYVGIHTRTSTGGGNGTFNQFLASQINSNFSGIMGENTNASQQYTRGLGTYSATFSTTGLPAAVPISQVRGMGASLVLRQPIFYMVNGTF